MQTQHLPMQTMAFVPLWVSWAFQVVAAQPLLSELQPGTFHILQPPAEARLGRKNGGGKLPFWNQI